jgi:hypothetical protein
VQLLKCAAAAAADADGAVGSAATTAGGRDVDDAGAGGAELIVLVATGTLVDVVGAAAVVDSAVEDGGAATDDVTVSLRLGGATSGWAAGVVGPAIAPNTPTRPSTPSIPDMSRAQIGNRRLRRGAGTGAGPCGGGTHHGASLTARTLAQESHPAPPPWKTP